MPAETHSHGGRIGAADVERIVREQIAEILGVDPDGVGSDTRLRDDLDADDFAILDLVDAVEAELGERSVGFAIEDDDLVELVSVRDVIEIVIARLGSPDAAATGEGA